MKPIILFAALVMATPQLKAQTNLALTAVATHSGGGATIYSAANYNDNIIPACTGTCTGCTATPWGWVTSGASNWIEYRWTSPQMFDKVVFYKASRAMSKTKLQYWDGTAYIDIIAYNSTVCPADSITFPLTSSTRLRFFGMEGASNPNFREIKVFFNTPPCNGMPTPGLLSGSSPSGTGLCKSTAIELMVNGATTSPLNDIKYQWQRQKISFPPGGWENIAGATDTLYGGDTLTGWNYRLSVICTRSEDTAYTAEYKLPQLPTPEVNIMPAGPASFCLGDTVWLVANNHPGGIYTWMKDGAPVFGWKFNDFGATEGGTYTVKVETTDPCPGYAQSVILTAVDPGYTVDITTVADSALCEGEAVTLFGSSSKPGVTYQWLHNNIPIPGATASFYTVNTAGYFRVSASDGSACRSLSRNASFIVYPTPDATINVPGGTLTVCEGKGLLLVSSKAYEYQWSFNGNPVVGWNEESLLVKKSGVYTVKVRSSDGCVNTSVVVSVSVLPAPIPVISKSGLVLSTSPGFAFYTWKRNGTETVSAGAGKSTFDLVKKGLYTVTVIDENGCEGTSDPIEAMDGPLAIGNVAVTGQEIMIYPNPANEKVFIKSSVPVNVKVENISGQLLYSGDNVTEVSLDAYADGLYLFTLTDREGNILAKEKIYKMTH
jgi:hypothetical protein